MAENVQADNVEAKDDQPEEGQTLDEQAKNGHANKDDSQYKEEFDALCDESGYITAADLEIYWQKDNKNPTTEEINDILKLLEVNEEQIGLEDFKNIQMAARSSSFYTADVKKDLKEAMKVYDKDDDGTISKDELKDILKDYEDEHLESIIKMADTNKDGNLSIDELVNFMTQ